MSSATNMDIGTSAPSGVAQAVARPRLRYNWTGTALLAVGSLFILIPLYFVFANGIMIYPCVMDDYLAECGVVPLDIANVPKKPVGVYQMNESAQDDRIADIVKRLQTTSRAKLPQLFT